MSNDKHDATYAFAPSDDAAPAPKRKRHLLPKGLALAVAGGIVAFSFAACSGGGDDAPEPAPTVTVTAPAAPSETATAEAAPSSSAPTTPNQTPAPSVTPEDVVEVSQEFSNALASAESYLSFTSFSKAGLYDQLTSEYGEGFPADAAQYAIDNLEVDWAEQALLAAETYYYEMDMSKAAVYEQLVSEYGEGFTEAEADYAVGQLK